MLKTQLNIINELFFTGNSSKTCQSKTNELIKFFKTKNLEKLKQKDVEKFVQYLKTKGNKASTINNKLAYLSKCLKYYKNPLVMPYQRIKEAEKSIIRPEDFKKLQKTIQDAEILQFINIAYYTGMRASEILTLKKGQIKKENGSFYVCLLQTKNKKQNLIPINSILNKVFENFQEFKINYQALYYKLQKYGINPHQFRHTYITRCFEAGLNSFTVMRLVNQTSLQSTKKYIHLTNKFLKNEVEKL